MTRATDDDVMRDDAMQGRIDSLEQRHESASRLAPRSTTTGGIIAMVVTLTLLVSPAIAEDAAPQPTAGTGAGAPLRLPMLSGQGPSTTVEGKIARSSRGRKGPVRLLVERQGGDPVTVLVAADDYCDRIGLSLRTGETVAAEGTMVKGERPILLASKITSDGKTVQIRDASGKLVDREAAGSNAARATFGGSAPDPEPDDKATESKGSANP